MWAQLAGHVGPSGARLHAFWGVCWAMLTHLDPQDRKNGKATKHRKLRYICRAGRAAPLSYGEKRTAVWQCVGPWPDFWADAHRRLRWITTLHFIAVWAWKLLNEDLLQKYILYVFGTYLLEQIRCFFRSKSVPETSCEGFFLKNCCQFQIVTWCKGRLCAKTSLCKNFCVLKNLCVKTTLCKDFFV